MKEYKNLGWENGWKETPKEIEEARFNGFKTREVGECGRCCTIYEIETDTQILRWKVDSSD